MSAGADLGGQGGQCPPSKIYYLHVTATINIMKISFSDVSSFINVKNYGYVYSHSKLFTTGQAKVNPQH